MARFLKSACEINDSDKKIEVALGHYNAEQFRSVGDRSPKNSIHYSFS